MKNKLHIQRLILFTTCCLFLGRAWQCYIGTIPLSTFIWDPYWFDMIRHFTSVDYVTFIQTERSSLLIDKLSSILSILLFLSAIGAFFAYTKKKSTQILVFIGFLILLVFHYLFWKNKFYLIGQLLEFTCQTTSPLILICYVWKIIDEKKCFFLIKLAISLTFIGHSFFALGVKAPIQIVNWFPLYGQQLYEYSIHPIPGHFIQMFYDTLNIGEIHARSLLKIAGILDILIAVGIFSNYKKIRISLLVYAAIWGFLTAFARIWANIYLDFLGETLVQWMYEFLVRVPHFMFPIIVLLAEKFSNNE